MIKKGIIKSYNKKMLRDIKDIVFSLESSVQPLEMRLKDLDPKGLSEILKRFKMIELLSCGLMIDFAIDLIEKRVDFSIRGIEYQDDYININDMSWDDVDLFNEISSKLTKLVYDNLKINFETDE